MPKWKECCDLKINVNDNMGYNCLELNSVMQNWRKCQRFIRKWRKELCLVVLVSFFFILAIAGWVKFTDCKRESAGIEMKIREEEMKKALERENQLREEAHRNLTKTIQDMTAEAEKNISDCKRESAAREMQIREEEEKKALERERQLKEQCEKNLKATVEQMKDERAKMLKTVREEEEQKRRNLENKVREEEEKRQNLQRDIDRLQKVIQKLKESMPHCNTGHMTTTMPTALGICLVIYFVIAQ